jgi:UDP-2,3-diacylglucosamine hydrolase
MNNQNTSLHKTNSKKIFFASDFHFGAPSYESSLKREKLFVKWLDEIKNEAEAIYLMGDVFDFWFEYKTVIPKGFVRLFGKLAEIADSGIPVHLFKGNHDIWAKNYLQNEVGLQLHSDKLIIQLGNKKFFLAHGDGLGPGDKGYKVMKKVFQNRFNQRLFRWLHPDVGARIAHYFSRKSRYANEVREEKNGKIPVEDEMLYIYSLMKSAQDPTINYFVFGHRHIPTNVKLNENARLVILGDWITQFTYAVFDGDVLELKTYLSEPAT